jgi:hypothetical protein
VRPSTRQRIHLTHNTLRHRPRHGVAARVGKRLSHYDSGRRSGYTVRAELFCSKVKGFCFPLTTPPTHRRLSHTPINKKIADCIVHDVFSFNSIYLSGREREPISRSRVLLLINRSTGVAIPLHGFFNHL